MYKIELGSKVVINSTSPYPELFGYRGVVVGERNGDAVLNFDGVELCLPYESLQLVIELPKPVPQLTTANSYLKMALNSVYGVGSLRTLFQLPDKIIFNEEKGKTTLLFANGNGGYESASSRTDGKDIFDKMLGFYMAYFKYLHADKDTEAFIENMYKEASAFNRLRYLKGSVDVFVSDLVTFRAMAEDVITKDVWVREEYEAQLKKEKNRIRKEAALKVKIEAKEAELTRLKGKLE